MGEMAGPATMASRACIGRVEERVRKGEVRGEGKRKEKGAETAEMTGRACGKEKG